MVAPRVKHERVCIVHELEVLSLLRLPVCDVLVMVDN